MLGYENAIYEDPRTHKFELVRLASKFMDSDKLPIPPTDRWFATCEDAVVHFRPVERGRMNAFDVEFLTEKNTPMLQGAM